MSEIEENLRSLGISLPNVPVPIAAYVPGVVDEQTIYTSGQLPMENGKLKYKGRLGESISMEEGYEAAKLCAINCLGVLKSLIGDLDRVTQIIKVVGFINCTADFEAQPKVLNGASEMMQAVFGKAGMHARSAVGVVSLPLGAPCEVEIIAKYR